MAIFELISPEEFYDNSYFKLSQLLLEDELSKSEIQKLITETTRLLFQFKLENPPSIIYLVESSNSQYYGQFKSVEKSINEILNKIDSGKTLSAIDKINESILDTIKSDERIWEIINNKNDTEERIASKIDPYIIFYLGSKISTQLRYDVLNKIKSSYN